MNAEQNAWIVRAMSDPSFYDHPVAEVELIETHISWVFLAGDFVYKVKKSLDLGFLDFSSLDKRQHFCREELRLNRNFTKQIYLDLVRIGGRVKQPVLNAVPALEYAVKMHRFPQECQLDRMLAFGQLQTRHIVAFAKQLAALHQAAQPAEEGTPFGSPEAAIKPIKENFRQIKPLVAGTATESQLISLEQQAYEAFSVLESVIAGRKDDGFVRACHGDVHLANMAWLEEQPVLFDCIEFNDNLRWIDVINDIAFLAMDLDDRKQMEMCWTFLNVYLQETGDYEGIQLLNLYKTYRAMVRAKVTCLRLSQGHMDNSEQQEVDDLFHSYLDLAEEYSRAKSAPLIITHGLSGAGKSSFVKQLASQYGAIHLRSDIERKRLYGLKAQAKSGSPIDGGIYSQKAFAETYDRLHDIARTVLEAGFPVIVDATFLKHQQREQFRQLAEELEVSFVLLDFVTPEEELRRRIESRAGDASEATLEVLDYQLMHQETLTGDEDKNAMKVTPETTVENLNWGQYTHFPFDT